MTTATLPARKDFQSYFFFYYSQRYFASLSRTHSILSMICNPTMCSVMLRAIFRNDDGITATGKRHYTYRRKIIPVSGKFPRSFDRDRRFIIRYTSVIKRPYPFCNSLTATIHNRRNRCRHRRRKSTMSLIRPVFNIAWKFPRRAALILRDHHFHPLSTVVQKATRIARWKIDKKVPLRSFSSLYIDV